MCRVGCLSTAGVWVTSGLAVKQRTAGGGGWDCRALGCGSTATGGVLGQPGTAGMCRVGSGQRGCDGLTVGTAGDNPRGVIVETRFGGNLATKKTQKTLLKQQYENFIASSTESIDSIFNRLQKIVSRLAIFGVVITQEDLNLKFLRSLPPEWNTHVVVWMNKAEIETMSIDDLYNDFKIVEQSVKKSVGVSSGAQNLAFMTAPSTNSTNDVNTAKPAYEVCTVSLNVNTASPQVSTASFSDNAVYAVMVENPNGSNLLHQDLEKIHKDDLEAMDLKWQLSLLSMRAKMECRAPRNKEGQFRNQDNTRKHGNNEDTSSKAMLAIDGVGFDWSDMAEEHAQTNMALMAFSDSE
ncbi:hypothetical protein Tco_0621792, partial [Tanacetum coccineum]